MPFALKPRARIVFTGDSITDCGRRSPCPPLGNGYVQMVTDLMSVRYPDHGIEVINTGISGNTVHDLFDRWSDDVVRHRPDWISVMIGINDMHLWLSKQDRGVSPELFEERYEQILSRARQQCSAQIVLADPFYISRDESGQTWRSRVLEILPRYQAVVERMVRKYEARHVKYHAMFQRQLDLHPADRYCPEPVHPNPAGHLLMAYEWLRTMGAFD
jgi:lysophospholipase L1-like esterase